MRNLRSTANEVPTRAHCSEITLPVRSCGAFGVPGRIPHDFRRDGDGGHRTESVYPRYAIADEAMLKEGAVKLAALPAAEKTSRTRKVAALMGEIESTGAAS